MARRCQVTPPAVCVGHVAPCWVTKSVTMPLTQVFTHNALMHHVAPRCALMGSVVPPLGPYGICGTPAVLLTQVLQVFAVRGVKRSLMR